MYYCLARIRKKDCRTGLSSILLPRKLISRLYSRQFEHFLLSHSTDHSKSFFVLQMKFLPYKFQNLRKQEIYSELFLSWPDSSIEGRGELHLVRFCISWQWSKSKVSEELLHRIWAWSRKMFVSIHLTECNTVVVRQKHINKSVAVQDQ